MPEIINSYLNGQFRQMVEQIDAYGPAQFAKDLVETDFIGNPATKLRIIAKYVSLKN